jgi:hypothetical protein
VFAVGLPTKLVTLIKICLNETCSEICIDKHSSENGLEHGDPLSFALEYAIGKVLESQMGLRLNGTHQLLVYAGDANLLADNINTIKKNTKSLTNTSKEVGL